MRFFSQLAVRLWQSPVYTSAGNYLIKFAGFAVILPLALSILPATDLALWLLFTAVLTLVALVDMGFNPTFIRFIAYSKRTSLASADETPAPAKHQSEFGDTAKVVACMRYVYRRLGYLALAIAGCIGSYFVAGPITELADPARGWVCWLLIVISSAITVSMNSYAAFLQGIEKIAIVQRCQAITSLIFATANIIYLTSGGGLVGLVLISQAGLLTNCFVNRALAIRYSMPGSGTADPDIDTNLLGKAWSSAWRSGVGIIFTLGIIQSTGMVYAKLATPEELASYLLALRLIYTIRGLANIPFYTYIPQMSRMYAEGNNVGLIRLARNGMFYTNWSMLLAILLLAVGINPILDLIQSNTEFVSGEVWLTLGLAILLERIGAMHLQLYTTTNHILWHFVAVITGAIMLLTIPVSYYFLGVIGFPVGVLISYLLFFAPYSMSLTYRAFGLDVRQIDLFASILPAVILGACVLAMVVTF